MPRKRRERVASPPGAHDPARRVGAAPPAPNPTRSSPRFQRTEPQADAAAAKLPAKPTTKAARALLVKSAADGAQSLTMTPLQARLLPVLNSYSDLYYAAENEYVRSGGVELW